MNAQKTTVRVLAALSLLLGVAFTAAGAAAQTDDDADVTCVSVDLGDQQLQIGIADRTSAVPVNLPAGTVTIPSARATDGYPSRVNVTQNSEKYEVEFLSASGAIIAVSAPTGDVPDMVEFGEWIGDLGSVELSEPAVAVRAHHRPDLPGDGSPESLKANELTLCFQVSAPVCGDDGVTTNPDGTPCDTTCDDDGVTTNPDGTPCEPTTTEPACGDDGVTTNPDGTPCDTTDTTSSAPTVTTVPATTSTTGEVAGPTTSTTEAPVTTTEAPTTTEPTTTTTDSGEVAGPTDTQLPLTGSESGLLLALGSMMIALGGGALVLSRTRTA